MSGVWRATLLILFALASLAAAEIGDDGDLRALAFSGNELIPDTAIQRVLGGDPVLTAARHPRADRATYAGVLEGRLLRAYRASGFAEAAVLVLPAADGWSVEIREGPRQGCAAVVFEGEVGDLPLAELRAHLQGEDGLWPVDGFAPAHAEWAQPIQIAIGAWLAERGLHGSFSLARRPAGDGAELVVTVAEPPVPETVVSVQVAGLDEAQAAVVAGELAPLVGAEADLATLERARVAALSSARVQACAGRYAPGEAGMTLVVDATPLPGAPGPDEDLGTLEREVVAATTALAAALDEGRYTAALEMRGPLFQLVVRAGRDRGEVALEAPQRRSALGVDLGGLMLIRLDGSRLHLPLPGAGGFTLSLGIRPEGEAGRIGFSTNAGFVAKGDPWRAEFSIHPAALVGKVQRRTEVVAEGDLLRISAPGTEDPSVIGWIEIDRAAGIVTAIDAGSAEPGKGMTLRFAPSPDAAADRPPAPAADGWVELAAAARSELLDWREWLLVSGEVELESLEQIERFGGIALRLAPILPALARGLGDSIGADDETGFHLPPPPPGGNPLVDLLRPVACSLLFALEGRLPGQSWPATILREAIMITGGRGAATGRELDRLYRDQRTGPIGSLALAAALELIGQQGPAQAFARRGAELCAWPQARVDVQLLMPLLAPMVAALDGHQRAALCAALPAALGPQVRDALEAEEAPVETALQLIWDAVLGDALRQQLRAMAEGEADAGP